MEDNTENNKILPNGNKNYNVVITIPLSTEIMVKASSEDQAMSNAAVLLRNVGLSDFEATDAWEMKDE